MRDAAARRRARPVICGADKRPNQQGGRRSVYVDGDQAGPFLKYASGFADAGTRGRGGCGACAGCAVVDDCGACINCLDKPKFGGPNIKHQQCVTKKCCVGGDAKQRRKRTHAPRFLERCRNAIAYRAAHLWPDAQRIALSGDMICLIGAPTAQVPHVDLIPNQCQCVLALNRQAPTLVLRADAAPTVADASPAGAGN